ncbi:hypothetical protein ACE5IS_08790 [Leptospira wolffii]|uniref:Alginate export domain-containing protein n=1 Tax=Leptospira wolffii TaxID=409998 RepID=A0ABV5BML9_9LEPT
MSPKRVSKFLIFFLLSAFWRGIYAESYSNFRMDDSSLLRDGVIPVRSQGRASSVSENPPKYRTDSGFYSSLYAWAKGDSQKGGVREDQARKSYGRASIAPEFGWFRESESSRVLFLISPIFTYSERDESKREIFRLQDGEAILSLSKDIGYLRIRGEAGRGFQRLDGMGFLFSNIMNYAEIGWEILPWKLRGSLMGGEFSSSVAYSDRDRSESPLRILGGDLVWEPESVLKSMRLYHYQYGEPRQEAVRADLYRNEEPFRAYGYFRYSGGEWESRVVGKTKLEATAIHVEGRRENATNPLYSDKSRQTTNSWMGTLGVTWKEDTVSYFVRTFYSKEDQNFRIDRNSDGYSPIKGDPRGLLAPFSILLLRDFSSKEDTVFFGVDSPRKPVFENSGIQYYQFGASKEWGGGWASTLAGGFGISYIGRGLECIATSGWKGESGYIVGGIAYAWVDPERDESYIIDEIRRPVANREYFRWYASGGIRF